MQSKLQKYRKDENKGKRGQEWAVFQNIKKNLEIGFIKTLLGMFVLFRNSQPRFKKGFRSFRGQLMFKL